jgi:hypothetical protein
MLPLLPSRRRGRFQRDGAPGVVERLAVAIGMILLPFLLVMFEIIACSPHAAQAPMTPPAVSTLGIR